MYTFPYLAFVVLLLWRVVFWGVATALIQPYPPPFPPPLNFHKGPVKLMQWVKIAHSFLVCNKSVPSYHFKLAYVILQMAVKEFFETHF